MSDLFEAERDAAHEAIQDQVRRKIPTKALVGIIVALILITLGGVVFGAVKPVADFFIGLVRGRVFLANKNISDASNQEFSSDVSYFGVRRTEVPDNVVVYLDQKTNISDCKFSIRQHMVLRRSAYNDGENETGKIYDTESKFILDLINVYKADVYRGFKEPNSEEYGSETHAKDGYLSIILYTKSPYGSDLVSKVTNGLMEGQVFGNYKFASLYQRSNSALVERVSSVHLYASTYETKKLLKYLRITIKACGGEFPVPTDYTDIAQHMSAWDSAFLPSSKIE